MAYMNFVYCFHATTQKVMGAQSSSEQTQHEKDKPSLDAKYVQIDIVLGRFYNVFLQSESGIADDSTRQNAYKWQFKVRSIP